MKILLKLVHLLAVSAFVGSIFGHILLGAAFGGDDIKSYLVILRAKAALTDGLILGGIAVCALSGLGLLLAGGLRRMLRPWLLAKLAAVALIAANALLVLRPLGLDRIALAAGMTGGGPAPDAFVAAGAKENLFGAANLALVLIVIALSVARRLPFARGSARAAQAIGASVSA